MRNAKQNLSGDRLTEIFRTAMIVRSTAEYAKTEAAKSERDTLNSLDYLSQGSFLNPGNLPAYSQEQIARSSVDAHIKKVQAEQINQQSNIQMIDLEQESQMYVGKKVQISILNRDERPVEAIWFDPNSGSYYTSAMNPKAISGKIEKILLDRNAIMLKPTLLYKLSSKNRHFFVVYITNPNNLEPLVQLQM